MTSPRRTTGLFSLPALNSSAETFQTLPNYAELPPEGHRTATPADEARLAARLAATSLDAGSPPRGTSSTSAMSMPPAPRRTLPSRPTVSLSPPPQAGGSAVAARSGAQPQRIYERAPAQQTEPQSRMLTPLSKAHFAEQVAVWKLRATSDQPQFVLGDKQIAYLREIIDACSSRAKMQSLLRKEPPAGIDEAVNKLALYLQRTACHEAKLAVPTLFDNTDIRAILNWSLLHHPSNNTTLKILCPTSESEQRYKRIRRLLNPLVHSAFVSDDPGIRRCLISALGSYLEEFNRRVAQTDDRNFVNHLRRLNEDWLRALVKKLTDSADGAQDHRSDVRRLWLKDFASMRLGYDTAATLHLSFTALVNSMEQSHVEPSISSALLDTHDGQCASLLMTLLATLLDYSV